MEYIDYIQSFYLTYFGRPVDQEGLEYWNGRIIQAVEDGSGEQQSIMAEAAVSEEPRGWLGSRRTGSPSALARFW